MKDRKGDANKQPPECRVLGNYKMPCPNLKERNDHSMSGETYKCDVCGEYFFLDYEDMK
jgi:hypothetical protein